MKLLLDAGNSRVKLGWLTPDGTREPAAAALPRDGLAQALAAWLGALPAAPTSAHGVNVGGLDLAAQLERGLAPLGCPLVWHTAQPETLGLINGYREPARLGADRWLALVGLWAHPRHRAVPGAPAATRILATFGTATTVDTISVDGRFLGGLILPGVQLMLDSLARGTADLPLAGGTAADFPDHTHAAIVSGVIAAQAGAVLRQCRLARRHFPAHPVQVAVAGGAWPTLAPELADVLADPGLASAPQVLDNPVLDGLAMLAGASPDVPRPFHA